MVEDSRYSRNVRPHFNQGPSPVLNHSFVGGVESQWDRHHGRAYQCRQAGREVGREDQGVEAVIRQQTQDALRTGDFHIVLIRGPELGARVVEAEGEGLVPHRRVPVRVVFLGESVGEVFDVGEVVHVVRVVGEHGEVLVGQVGDEVDVQDDVLVRAVVVSGQRVGGDVGVVDDCGAGFFYGFDGGVEGGYDGVVWFLGWVDHVAGDPDALAAQAGEVAGGDVVGRCVEGLSQRVVVTRILAGDGLEDVGCVFDRPRHRTYRVLALTDGNDEGSRGESYGWFDAYEIAHLTRAQDTAGRFGSESCKRKTDCGSDAAAAGTPTGVLAWVIDSVALTAICTPSVRAVVGSEVCPLTQVRLAQDDDACSSQFRR